mmetsp:Transcript_9938/g.11256  ORF Transcript_9938/g.11256 Transcript_9938/m.11256 type:complete len:255 (+) Transcript_9938:316-1080(+)
MQELRHFLEVLLLETSGCEGRGAHADTARAHRALVSVDRVLVQGDAHGIAARGELAASQLQGPEVPQNQVIVGASRRERVPLVVECLSQGFAVGQNLERVLLELGSVHLLHLHGHPSDRVVVGAALNGRKDGKVDAGLKVHLVVFAEENHGRARSSQTLVRGGCNDMRVRERVIHDPCSHKSADMRHIGQEQCANSIADLSQTLVLPFTRIGARSTDDHFWPEDLGGGLKVVVIHQPRLGRHVVRQRLVEDRSC